MKKVTFLAVSILFMMTSMAQSTLNLPYFTGFEGVMGNLNHNYPSGWTYEDLNTTSSNSSWEIVKNSATYTSARTDSTCIHIFSNMAAANDDYLYTPGIQMNKGRVYTMTFWYKCKPFGATKEKLEVMIGTDTVSTALQSTALWNNANITNELYQQATVSYTPTDSNVYYFAFHSYSDAMQFVLFVDDISIFDDLNSGMATTIENLNIKIGPNPCKSYIDIMDLKADSKYNFELYSSNGKLIQHNILAKNQNRIQLQGVKTGSYFLRIYSTDRKQVFFKQIQIIE